MDSFCRDGFCAPPECLDDDDCAPGLRCAENECMGRLDPHWGCIGEDQDDKMSPVQMTLPVLTITGVAVAGQEVQVCERFNVRCDPPQQTLASGEGGRISLTLEPDFQGFITVDSEDYYPQLYVLPHPLLRDARITPLTMIEPDVVETVFTTSSVQLDPERGHVMLTTIDCNGERTGGLTFSTLSADEHSTAFYNVGIPSFDQTETQPDSGSGGFVNLPIGTTQIELKLQSTGQIITQVPVMVRAGTLTQANLILAEEQL